MAGFGVSGHQGFGGTHEAGRQGDRAQGGKKALAMGLGFSVDHHVLLKPGRFVFGGLF
jgi:hypothetical protein